VAHKLKSKKQIETPYLEEIGSIVSAACLAHDLGNPPFGHSGETAIATYFSEGNGQHLANDMTAEEWKDIICFEGNANALRLLTHQFNGRRPGGFVLTYSTLASIVKYPYASIFSDPKKQKFGFFDSEKADYLKIAAELGIPRSPENPNRYARHPLVYLVEAADDICYQIMDIEDAHKLKILTSDETKDLFLGFFNDERRARRLQTMNMVTDVNEQIAYLRSSVIGQLIEECSAVFADNEEAILNGTFSAPLIKRYRNIRPKPTSIVRKRRLPKSIVRRKCWTWSWPDTKLFSPCWNIWWLPCSIRTRPTPSNCSCASPANTKPMPLPCMERLWRCSIIFRA